jgi:hypothetical protein
VDPPIRPARCPTPTGTLGARQTEHFGAVVYGRTLRARCSVEP